MPIELLTGIVAGALAAVTGYWFGSKNKSFIIQHTDPANPQMIKTVMKPYPKKSGKHIPKFNDDITAWKKENDIN